MASIKNLNSKQLLALLPKNSGYLIAYSGGADSTALLHLFANVPKTRAIHINHGLQSQAYFWQDHCQATCDQLFIPLIIEQAQLADSSENSCRIARQHYFKKHLRKNEILLTAHHSQDQVETVLLKLFRGTGTNGLTGMDGMQKFSNGFLARPLLNFSPDILKKYLQLHGIPWIEDPSNLDNKYSRNHLRNNIIPQITKHWPSALETISRSSENIKKTQNLLDYLIGGDENPLKISQLVSLPEGLRTSYLYHWLSLKGILLPDKRALQQIQRDFISARPDKNPKYSTQNYQLHRWKEAIYCIRSFETINTQHSFKWDTRSDFTLPNHCGSLHYSGKHHLQCIIRFNQKGQNLKPQHHNHHKTVKNLFQNHSIPPWQKQNTPFIYHRNKLISLGYSWSHTQNIHGGIHFNPKELMF